MTNPKSQIKGVLNKLYWKIINKLSVDLDIVESKRLLNHIIIQNDKLNTHMAVHESAMIDTNVLLGGTYGLKKNTIDDNNLLDIEYRELINILKATDESEIAISSFLKPFDTSFFKDKIVCILGASSPLYTHIIKKLGARKITRVIMSPLIFKDTPMEDTFIEEKVIFIYPTQLKSIKLELVDILLIPNVYTSSFLIKHELFSISRFVKDLAVINLKIKSSTVFSKKDILDRFIDNNEMVYSDNLARKMIHLSGFVEVSSPFTRLPDGVSQDKKVSVFNYQNGLTITKQNKNPAKKYAKEFSTRLYLARKLPSKLNINRN